MTTSTDITRTRNLTEAFHLAFDVKDTFGPTDEAFIVAAEAVESLRKLMTLTGVAVPRRFDRCGR